MADTYTQLHIQLVFAVKYRTGLIAIEWKQRLHKYITGILELNGHKMLQINSVPDHIHILVGMRPVQSLSAIVQNIKTESSKWIRKEKLTPLPFAWQTGYGAFSYSKSHVPAVSAYIQNQEVHHKKENFIEEYKRLLKGFGVAYEEQYLFKEPG